jgi:hypothetical protein
VPDDASPDVSRTAALQRQADGQDDECDGEFHVPANAHAVPASASGTIGVTMTSSRSTTCVFCGQPIAEGEPTAGRPPAAAHVACADRALTDDSHWDAIAVSSGDRMEDEGAEPASLRAGCLTGALVAVVILTLLRRRQSRT